jgi:hypothetical protein
MNNISPIIISIIFSLLFSTNILAVDLSLPSIVGANNPAANTNTNTNTTPNIATENIDVPTFTDDDKEALKELRGLLNKQPQIIRDEVSLYRSFIEKLKKEKQDYYDELSSEAKDFLKNELQLKNKLSTKNLQEYYKKKLFK